jgi:beta-lactamase class A
MQRKFLAVIDALPPKIIIISLIFTNIFSILFCIYQINHDTFKSAQDAYPLLDPARNFIDQKHFITNIQSLRLDLRNLVATTTDAKISIYFEVLNTGANISINQDDRYVPGSLIKMPTALAVMKKIEDGQWKLSNRLVLFDEDKDDGYGNLYKKDSGTSFTVEELLNELLINSDDTAHKIFMRNLHNDELKEVYRGLGLEDLLDESFHITAKEYSRIYRTLYTSSFLQRDNSEYLLQLLSKTRFNNFLEAGIPSDVTFSHKIGEHDPTKTYLDSGIVYIENRPYILTVAIRVGSEQSYAEKLMKEISKKAYEYIKNH